MSAYESAGESDEWYTPKYIFDALGETFDLDVAAPIAGPRHVPAKRWYYRDALDLKWDGFVWMNPPFGHQRQKRQWLSKFFAHGNGIALIPDRTSAPWWQEYAALADAVCFVAPKIKFEIPEEDIEYVRRLDRANIPVEFIVGQCRFSELNVQRIIDGEEPVNAPGTGTCLFAAGDRAARSLKQSNLGLVR